MAAGAAVSFSPPTFSPPFLIAAAGAAVSVSFSPPLLLTPSDASIAEAKNAFASTELQGQNLPLSSSTPTSPPHQKHGGRSARQTECQTRGLSPLPTSPPHFFAVRLLRRLQSPAPIRRRPQLPSPTATRRLFPSTAISVNAKRLAPSNNIPPWHWYADSSSNTLVRNSTFSHLDPPRRPHMYRTRTRRNRPPSDAAAVRPRRGSEEEELLRSAGSSVVFEGGGGSDSALKEGGTSCGCGDSGRVVSCCGG